MTKSRNTVYGIVGLVVGLMGGVGGTAFSVGAEQQKVKDNLTRNTTEIASVQQEMHRYSEIIATQITALQTSVTNLTGAVGDLRTDVHVLKALMERMEDDLKSKH